MSTKILKSVNFGRRYVGLDTIGYTLVDDAGAVLVARRGFPVPPAMLMDGDVYEVGTSTGIYAALIDFSVDHANVLWDTGTSTEELPLRHATEQYNRLENNPKTDELWDSMMFLTAMTAGRWSIDEATKQMIFYEEDNTTIIARFNLFGKDGLPSYAAVFSRIRNDGNIAATSQAELLDALSGG